MEKGWENTKQKQQSRILDFYIQRERGAVKMVFGILLFWLALFFGIMGFYNYLLILILIGIVGGWGLQRICGSYLSIAYSQVGKELRIYGKLKEVKKDVEEQAKKALYCSGDQAITEKYLILLSSVSKRNIPGRKKEGLCLISTRELEQISIVDSLVGESAEKRGYTMRFLTWDKRSFRLTVWKTYEEVCQIQKKLEECRDLGIGPIRSQEYRAVFQDGRNAAGDIVSYKRQIMEKLQQFYKEMILGKTGTIQEYYKKKRWFCMIAYFGVLGIFVMIIGLVVWVEWDSFRAFFQDVYWEWTEIGLWVSVYLLPMFLLFAYFYWMERQVMRQYQRLKYYEQQEMDRNIAEALEVEKRSVVCGKRCFWFQDNRRLGLCNLVFYEDVIWIYLSVRKIPISISVQNVGNSVLWLEYGVEFYTLDGKRHRVSMEDGKGFLEYFPGAIKGYGKEQKREYRELRYKMGKKFWM